MIMASISLLKENPDATEQEIREGLEEPVPLHGYENIVKAVRLVQQHEDEAARGVLEEEE